MNISSILKRLLIVTGMILTTVLVALAICLDFSVKWMFQTWNHLTMSELVYHLNAPLDGTNEEIIVEYINLCLAPTLLGVMAWIILLAAFREKKKRIIVAVGMVVSGVVIAMSIGNAWTTLDVSAYVKAQNEDSDFIKDYYVDPDSVEITFPQEKRNLIYIFLESMETTYADIENGGAFEDNVIPELTKLAQENEDFSGTDAALNGGNTLTGTTWTMGAMFGQTSGLPLQTSISANEMSTQETFFPTTTTIGDILDEQGYTQTLMVGSDATFGGRKMYFTDHGNYDVFDYPYAIESGNLPEGYAVWWGYED